MHAPYLLLPAPGMYSRCSVKQSCERLFVQTSMYVRPGNCNISIPRGVMSLTQIHKGRYALSVKLSDFTVWRHTWRENWVNSAVLTGNSAGLRNVFSSRLSHTELRSSLRESHSFLSLPADTTMASSQGTSVSSNSFSRWTSHASAVRLLRLWVRIPPGAWMFVCCECCGLSGRGLCDGFIPRPEESYRLWRVVVCDQETSKTRRLNPANGLWKYNHNGL
jgi:hypothetical protein